MSPSSLVMRSIDRTAAAKSTLLVTRIGDESPPFVENRLGHPAVARQLQAVTYSRNTVATASADAWRTWAKDGPDEPRIDDLKAPTRLIVVDRPSRGAVDHRRRRPDRRGRDSADDRRNWSARKTTPPPPAQRPRAAARAASRPPCRSSSPAAAKLRAPSPHRARLPRGATSRSGVAGEGGRVSAVAVDAGSWVRQGQVLAVDRSHRSRRQDSGAARRRRSVRRAPTPRWPRTNYERSQALVGPRLRVEGRPRPQARRARRRPCARPGRAGAARRSAGADRPSRHRRARRRA